MRERYGRTAKEAGFKKNQTAGSLLYTLVLEQQADDIVRGSEREAA